MSNAALEDVYGGLKRMSDLFLGIIQEIKDESRQMEARKQDECERSNVAEPGTGES